MICYHKLEIDGVSTEVEIDVIVTKYADEIDCPPEMRERYNGQLHIDIQSILHFTNLIDLLPKVSEEQLTDIKERIANGVIQ